MTAATRKTAEGSWDAGRENEALPTPEEWARSERDWQWFHENEAALLKQYPEQWVAIMDERVVLHAASLDKFMKELNRGDDPKGLAVRDSSPPRRRPAVVVRRTRCALTYDGPSGQAELIVPTD